MRRAPRAAALPLLLPLLLAGCTREETPEDGTGKAPRTEAPADPPAAPLPRPGRAGPPGPPSAPPTGARPASAHQEGGDPPRNACEGAYRTMLAMRAMQGGRGKPPPRERFLAACAQLPEEVQRCLDIDYHMRHPAECRAARDRVDPALRARVQAAMAGRDPASAVPSSAGREPGGQSARPEAREQQQKPGPPR